MDPSAAAAMQQNPQLRAQRLCELAKKSKLPPVLEVKDPTQLQQEGQPPRRFQIVQESIEKKLFNAEAPLVTARLPSRREILRRAQQAWSSQHHNSPAPQETELVKQGYVAKAQGELIAAENMKAQQVSGHVESLKAELQRFGYTLLPAV